jgi:acid phosphatase
VADDWLKKNIDPLISSATFQQDGLLIIVFDESLDSDSEHGGGHVAAVIVSAKARQGFQSTTFYQHQSVLRLILEGLGVTNFPGDSSTAPDMREFF